MTPLYAVTVMDIRNIRRGTSSIPDTRCVGIFLDFETAEEHVLNNYADVSDGGTNEYAVIEEVYPGQFYPLCEAKQWYIYDPEPSKDDEPLYFRTEAPEWAKGICNWGIG